MTRLSLTENIRRIRHEVRRCPVDAALFALCSLSKEQRDDLTERFNRTFQNGTPRLSMTFKEGPK